MEFHLLWSILFGTVIGQVVVPLDFRPVTPQFLGSRRCNITLVDTRNSELDHFPVSLYLGDTFDSFASERIPSFISGERRYEFQFRIGAEELRVHHHHLVPEGGKSVLSIGHASEVTTQFGSVSISGLKMTLGSTQSQFEEGCIAETFTRVPRLDNVTISTLSAESGGYRFEVSHTEYNWIMDVPRDVWEVITEQMISMGAEVLYRGQGAERYQNCTTHMISQLPDLTMSFGSGGSFSIHPNEYMGFSLEDSKCHPRVHIGMYSTGIIRFNPIGLEDIAFRVTRSDFNICRPKPSVWARIFPYLSI